MDLGDVVAATIALTITGLTLWVCLGSPLFRIVERHGLAKFHRFLDSLQSDRENYNYYIVGHLVWSETSIENIENEIRGLCINPLSSPASPQPPRFLLKCHEPSKSVYFVPTLDRDFDWESIPHYEDYVRTQT